MWRPDDAPLEMLTLVEQRQRRMQGISKKPSRTSTLSTDRLVDIQGNCFADDVYIDFAVMRFMTEKEAVAYFESGGRDIPHTVKEREMLAKEFGSWPPLNANEYRPAAFLQLERYRTWGTGGAVVRAQAAVASDQVGHVKRGGALLAIGSVQVDGRLWLKTCDPHDGYVDFRAADCKDASDEPRKQFEIVKAAKFVLPEPPRDARADITFTCTFNGRLGALCESISSVLRELDAASLRSIASWIIIADKDATPHQRLEAQRVMPWATFICKGSSFSRHPFSMNLLGAFVRTRWWVMWEDDFALSPGCSDLLARAKCVASETGYQQVAMNGAWLDGDFAWGARGPPDSTRARQTESLVGGRPVQYMRVDYPEGDLKRVRTGLASSRSARNSLAAVETLADAYLAGVMPDRQGGRDGSIMWPLFSLQPSLNDADFLKSLLPFREELDYNPSHAYWLFEFEYGLRYVAAGGRKATMPGPCARQLAVASSSGPSLKGPVSAW